MRRYIEPAAPIEDEAKPPKRVRVGRFLIQGSAERLFGPALVYPFLSLAIRRGKIFSPLLISLIRACELIKEVFPGPERKEAKKKIAPLVKNEAFGKAIAEEITAIIAACVIASTAASIAALS